MKSMWKWTLASMMAVGLVLAAPSRGMAEEKKAPKSDEKVTLAQVPEAVKATIVKEAGKNDIKEIEKEVKGDKTTYSAEWGAEGKKVEIDVASDGKLVGKEEQLTMDQLPEAVSKAMKKEAGDSKIEKVKKELEDGKVTYSAEWMAGGKATEGEFAEDGALLKKEAEEASKEGEKKGEDKD